jgi:uncharacterized protein (DUF362 family)
MPRVSLIKGESRKKNIEKSIKLISDDIKRGLKSRQVIIKPNFVSTSIQLASSHVDQIRGILDFLKGFYADSVIIAEAACGDTMRAYKNFGYFSLAEDYDVKLIDLNKGPFEKIAVKDGENRVIPVRVSSLLLDRNNYLISAAKLKTHDTVIVTLSIKNLAMGSIFFSDKKLIHQGVKETNINIAEIAKHVWPDLSVIDGLEGMEGDGPIRGKSIYTGIALASTDSLAVDRVACKIMGLDFHNVGYLHYCSEKGLGVSDLQKIEVVGHQLNDCIKPFKLYRNIKEQLAWKENT